MLRFYSYGPVDEEEHYHVPRIELIENRAKYEATYRDPKTQIVVEPIFIETG